MTLEDILFKALPYLLAFVGTWAVVRHKTDAHGRAIGRLEATKEELKAKVSALNTEVAVLKSKSEERDRRLSEGLDRIDRAIEASETRVIAHVDFLVKQLTEK